MNNAERFFRNPKNAHIATLCSRAGSSCSSCRIGHSEIYERCFSAWCGMESGSDDEILSRFNGVAGVRQLLEKDGDILSADFKAEKDDADLSDRLADAVAMVSLLAGVVGERDKELLFVIERMRSQMEDTRNMLDWLVGSIRQRGYDYDFLVRLWLDKIAGVKK